MSPVSCDLFCVAFPCFGKRGFLGGFVDFFCDVGGGVELGASSCVKFVPFCGSWSIVVGCR